MLVSDSKAGLDSDECKGSSPQVWVLVPYIDGVDMLALTIGLENSLVGERLFFSGKVPPRLELEFLFLNKAFIGLKALLAPAEGDPKKVEGCTNVGVTGVVPGGEVEENVGV